MSVAGPNFATTPYEERRIGELRRWKRRANLSLLGAFVVFLVSHFFGGEGGVNGFIRAASEAALIGGIADWFAVTALFRHPLGIRSAHRPHTEEQRRDRTGAGRVRAEELPRPGQSRGMADQRRDRRPVGEMAGLTRTRRRWPPAGPSRPDPRSPSPSTMNVWHPSSHRPRSTGCDKRRSPRSSPWWWTPG